MRKITGMRKSLAGERTKPAGRGESGPGGGGNRPTDWLNLANC
jgi:hypothetical protein